jgi:aspartate racemase
MKTIGLVGGTTPESTRVYYDLLIRGARKPGGDPLHNPKIIIYSIDLAELVHIQRAGDRQGVARYLAEVLERLRTAGAEIGAFTANTPHAYLDEVRAATSLPLVSIVTATRDVAANMGLGRTLLLGTRTTVEAGMYPNELERAGIDVVLPDEAEREFFDDIIYGDLAIGRISQAVSKRCLDISRRYIDEQNIDSVILGCTELPLVISGDDLPIEVLDTTVIHAAAILEAAA